MAHFYGRLIGGGAEVTRTGTKKSDIKCTIQSSDLVVDARLRHSTRDSSDFGSIDIGDHESTRKFGEVDIINVDGKHMLRVNGTFLRNCHEEYLIDEIMRDERLVDLLRGRIFVEGRADG